MKIVLLALLLGGASCSRRAPVSRAPTESHIELRDRARLVLEKHCGACHIRDYPTTLPKALAVFDLTQPEWSTRMSEAQLRNAHWRLGEPLAPEGRQNDVTDEERTLFGRFVEAEIARRRGQPISE